VTHQVVWTFAALTDIQEIRRYIANFNPDAATAMAAKIIEIGDDLSNFPYRGRQVPDTDLRETALARPYIIRYRIEGNRVILLRVRHGRRRPTNP
jgi:addiction module RelE/StbE family toxin